MNTWSIEDLGDSETVLYDKVMADTKHYTFVKTQRTVQKVNPNINYGP